MKASHLQAAVYLDRCEDPEIAPALSFSNGKLEGSGAWELQSWAAQHGEIPLKACYGGRGAGAWRSIVSSVGYELGLRERRCLEAFLFHISSRLSSVGVVVHLGSGDGAELPIILRQPFVHRDLLYTLVDISPDLMDLASDVYCSLGTRSSLTKLVADIETQEGHDFISAVTPNRPRLIMLVANGALLSDHLVWQTLRNSMREVDHAVIMLEVADFSDPQTLANSYRIPPIHDLLRNGLRQVGFRPPATSAGYDVSVSENELAVRWTPALAERQRWEAQTGLELPDAALVLLRSLKPTYNAFLASLCELGFEICESLNDPFTQCAGFLVKRSC